MIKKTIGKEVEAVVNDILKSDYDKNVGELPQEAPIKVLFNGCYDCIDIKTVKFHVLKLVVIQGAETRNRLYNTALKDKFKDADYGYFGEYDIKLYHSIIVLAEKSSGIYDIVKNGHFADSEIAEAVYTMYRKSVYKIKEEVENEQ